MRVLWIHNFDPANKFSGIFMKQMVEPLKKIGIDVDLYYVGKLRKQLLDLNGTIKKLNKARQGYDIIHAQYGSLNGYVVSRTEGPKLVSLRGSDWHRIKKTWPLFDFLHGCASVWFSNLSLKHYKHVITMSNRMSKEVRETSPHTVVYTLPDAINLSKFKKVDYHEARRELGIPENQKWVIFASVLNDNPIKRPFLAKEAIRIAKQKNNNIVFKPLVNIPHDQMPKYYSAADAIITTSVHEGWPNCIKEALACDLPFIATNTGDLAEIAALEDTCHVCKDTAEDLAEALLDTLSKERPTDLKKYVDPMDMPNFVKELAEIYRKVLQS